MSLDITVEESMEVDIQENRELLDEITQNSR